MNGNQAKFAAVDWGTTNLRIWLLDAYGNPLAGTQSEHGVSKLPREEFSPVLERQLTALGARSDLPAVICGMAGSRQGWIEAPYLSTPVSLTEILAGKVRVPGTARPVWIIPGIAQSGATAPNVMRGEETQLAGLTGIRSGDHWVCLPGTHSKWVRLAGGQVRNFMTFMTGDLFASLSSATILRHNFRGDDLDVDAGNACYLTWLKRALAEPEMLTSRLFEIRAAGLVEGSAPVDAPAALSGLLIGTEVAAATGKMGVKSGIIDLVAAPGICPLYEAAIRLAGFEVRPIDGETAVLAGLSAAANADLSIQDLAVHG